MSEAVNTFQYVNSSDQSRQGAKNAEVTERFGVMLPFIHLPVQAKSRLKKLALTAGSGLAVLALATGCASGSSTAAAQSESAAAASAASESAASESAASASAARQSAASASAASESAASASAASESAASASAAAESSAAAEASASAEAEASASASASAQAEKDAAEAEKKKNASAKTLNSRSLQRIVKDPDGHIGETVVVFGNVTQFDSATGLCTFRANIGHANMRYDWDYDHNAIFSAGDSSSDCPELDDVLQDDEVKITATVVSSYTYGTSIGGSATVPLFKVVKVQRI